MIDMSKRRLQATAESAPPNIVTGWQFDVVRLVAWIIGL